MSRSRDQRYQQRMAILPAQSRTADSAETVVEPQQPQKQRPPAARHRAILFGVGGPYVMVQEGKWNT